MLSVNEQTELDVLLSLEEPSELDKVRINYLNSKKDSSTEEEYTPVDLDSMECPCIGCFLRTIPEHSDTKLVANETFRYLLWASRKNVSFKTETVNQMWHEILNELELNELKEEVKPLSEFVGKKLNQKVQKMKLEEWKSNQQLCSTIFTAAAILQKKLIDSINPEYHFTMAGWEYIFQSIHSTLSVLDHSKIDFDVEPSWELLDFVHTNILDVIFGVEAYVRLHNKEFVHPKKKPIPSLDALLEGILENL